jgi:hypothetical protein
MPIPRIIHQIWIGPKPAPTVMLDTWRAKHPDCEYILWTEAEIVRRGMTFRCVPQIDLIAEINGKADILRWEILYKYGGIAIDADSACIEPLDDTFWSEGCKPSTTKSEERAALGGFWSEDGGFATYENESMRGNLVATGTMGFPPGHRLVGDILDWIASPASHDLLTGTRAWNSVGPGVLTRFLAQDPGPSPYPEFRIFPSYLFLPIHFTGGDRYEGHRKVYGYQEWGTAKQSYDTMNSVILPAELFAPTDPDKWVSVLVPSYNTPAHMVRECLDSILDQRGYVGIELVWINDGSDAASTAALESELRRFEQGCRFCRVVYVRWSVNRGIAASLRQGMEMCTCECVVRMDSDDRMLPHCVITQHTYMNAHPDSVLCGAGICMFDDATGAMIRDVAHPSRTWTQFMEAFCAEPCEWMVNQPGCIFRRSAVLAVGNYDPSRTRDMMEDYDLQLRLLRHYGRIDNVGEMLVQYRLHAGQMTQKIPSSSPECVELRRQILDKIQIPT